MGSTINLDKCLFRFIKRSESLKEFAARIGVTSQAIYSWRRGIDPRISTIEIVAENLNIHPALLLWDDVPGNEIDDASGEEELNRRFKRQIATKRRREQGAGRRMATGTGEKGTVDF